MFPSAGCMFQQATSFQAVLHKSRRHISCYAGSWRRSTLRGRRIASTGSSLEQVYALYCLQDEMQTVGPSFPLPRRKHLPVMLPPPALLLLLDLLVFALELGRRLTCKNLFDDSSL